LNGVINENHTAIFGKQPFLTKLRLFTAPAETENTNTKYIFWLIIKTFALLLSALYNCCCKGKLNITVDGCGREPFMAVEGISAGFAVPHEDLR